MLVGVSFEKMLMIRLRVILFAMLTLTGACAGASAEPAYRVETVAEGLDHPWSLAFLPDGRMLVTERAGRLRVIADGALREVPVGGVPPVYVASQAGLFDVLPAPDFAESGVLYLAFAHGTAKANNTRVVRARLVGNQLQAVTPIFTAQPLKNTPVHYGGRLAWRGDGTLIITLGDGYNFRERAQHRDDHLGTIVRLLPDGTVPADNPFVGDEDVRPEIFSYGHRNVQGVFYDAQADRLYAHEHGARGGDEVNLIQPGRNYGWPAITHGVDYSGAQISPYTALPGMEQPLLHWTPSIAPSGLTRYQGDAFPAWKGSFFVGALADQSVHRLILDAEGRLLDREVMFESLGVRVRDVRSGPDGMLYLLTDDAAGKVLRVVPAD